VRHVRRLRRFASAAAIGLTAIYIYGDVCTGAVRSARLGTHRAHGDRSEHLTVPYLDSFGRDARGRLYAISLLGAVFRISR
jgi:hypothetical protein